MNRLEELRTSRKLSRSDLAEIIGVATMTIYRYEKNERHINKTNLKKLSDFFGVSADYILGNEELPDSAPIPPEYHKVPIVGSVACSWDSGFIDDFDGEYSFINDYLYEKYGDSVRATYARGNSMLDMISPGDLLIVIPATDVQDNDIVIAEIGGDELTAKKYHRNEDGGFDLIPVNPSYGKQSFSIKDIKTLPVVVVARVIEIRKGLRP